MDGDTLVGGMVKHGIVNSFSVSFLLYSLIIYICSFIASSSLLRSELQAYSLIVLKLLGVVHNPAPAPTA